MSNTPIKMNKLRMIIYLCEEECGLKIIDSLSRTSRNTVKSMSRNGIVWESLMKRSNRKAIRNLVSCFVSGKAPIHPIPGWKSWIV